MQYREAKEVGDGYEIDAYTYGSPVIRSWGEGARLRMGRFCSIAEGVTIYLGGNHRLDWVTTYPFPPLMAANWPEVAKIEGHPTTNGDVIIGHDVWLAANSVVLSGVNIGSGAAIGANAVVSRDVPPYCLVAGNPAKIVRQRFDDDTVGALLKLAWWDWPIEKIRAHASILCSPDAQTLLSVSG